MLDVCLLCNMICGYMCSLCVVGVVEVSVVWGLDACYFVLLFMLTGICVLCVVLGIVVIISRVFVLLLFGFECFVF